MKEIIMPNAQDLEKTRFKVVIEHAEDGYIAYPLGMRGIVVGQGDTYREALADVTSAIKAHLETFGMDCLLDASHAEEAFIAETEVSFST
jgi:predicted RNase H-like HicB family nuclease